MKKVFTCFVALVMVLVLCVSMAFADSDLGEYHRRMQGTWAIVSATTTRNYTSLFEQVYDAGGATFEFPAGGSWTYMGTTDNYSFLLVGDDSGEVYLLGNSQYFTTIARVLLSEDNNTMVLIVPIDGSQFVLIRQQ